MFSTSDTIVAIATPPGHGGLGVVRVSGPAAHDVAQQLTDRTEAFEIRRATLARVRGGAGAIDRVIVTTFAGPQSYTGEDVAEISAHGSPVLLRSILAAAISAGARLANPGEFTLRAYLHGRLDLIQAEAVRDLVEAVTPLQARAAFDQLEGTLTHDIAAIDRKLFHLAARLEASLDFPDEGYHFVSEGAAAGEIAAVAGDIAALLSDARRGRLLRDGAQVVLTGRPNAGKSSLFNRLAGAGRAIVTDVPGTTRDLIVERVELGGVPITLVDTAGIRYAPADAIESEGIARAAAARDVAAVVVVVLDGSQRLTDDDHALLRETAATRRLVVASKSDLPGRWEESEAGTGALRVSALTGAGIDEMSAALLAVLGAVTERDVPAITNLRHVDLLARAADALERARTAASGGAPEEFVLSDVNQARELLEEITGRRTPDDVLEHIFSKFCIGK